MAMQAKNRSQVRLPPEVNRILYVRNLPYKITAEEMYDIFGKYGAIRQIRVGTTPETKGKIHELSMRMPKICPHNFCEEIHRYLIIKIN